MITTQQGGIGHTVYGLDRVGRGGEYKELKKTAYSGTLRLGGLRGLEPHVRALASGYGSEGLCLGSTKAHSATQSNSPGPGNPHEESAKAEATHKNAKQAEKQAG